MREPANPERTHRSAAAASRAIFTMSVKIDPLWGSGPAYRPLRVRHKCPLVSQCPAHPFAGAIYRPDLRRVLSAVVLPGREPAKV